MPSFLQDDNGKKSSLRLVWVAIVFTFLFVWAYLCISKGEWIHFEVGDALALTGLMGIKPAQKYIEMKNGGKSCNVTGS